MLLTEIKKTTTSKFKKKDAIGIIASYLVLGGISSTELMKAVQLLSTDPSLIYNGKMYRFIGAGNFDPTKATGGASWSMSMEGLSVALDNLASTRGINGIIIEQTGSGLNIPAVIDKHIKKFSKWLDEDELDELGEYYDEEEVISIPNNPITIFTVKLGKLYPIEASI